MDAGVAVAARRSRCPARLGPALRPRPDRPPPRALPPRRDLRAQLPRPDPTGRARLASRARPLLRRAWSGSGIFSLSPAPKRVWQRSEVTFVGRREPEGPSRCRSTPTTWWSPARRRGPVELAMGPASLTGFQSWLEAGPPGADCSCDRADHGRGRGRARATARSRSSSRSTGFCFATLVSRLPDVRSGLDLDNGSLGLLLLAIAVGSVHRAAAERAADRPVGAAARGPAGRGPRRRRPAGRRDRRRRSRSRCR